MVESLTTRTVPFGGLGQPRSVVYLAERFRLRFNEKEAQTMSSPTDGSTPAASGRIFISYRREETAYPAGWLYDRLDERFGGGQVFKDIDSIPLGDDFVDAITRAVGSCDVLLALIGDRWLTLVDERGHRRLDDPEDFVRLEIEAALARDVRVIPVLVDGAHMPRAEDMPPSLVKLVRRQALELSPSRFESDTSKLVAVLESTLADVQRAQGDTGPAARDAARAGQAEAPAAPQTALAAGAGGDAPPTGAPGDERRRRRPSPAWIIAGLAVAVAAVLLAVVIANRGGGGGGEAGSGSGGSGGCIEVDPTPVTSPDGLRLSALRAQARHCPPQRRDTVTVRYTLTNVGDQPVRLAGAFVAFRSGDGENRDAEPSVVDKVLAPGDSIAASGRAVLNGSGTWQMWPCYELDDGQYCPDEWQAAYAVVD
jgi:hypothetical protein